MTTRRKFLVQAGLASAAIMVPPGLLKGQNRSYPGIQLYSLRDQLPKDVKGVMAKVAKAGYKEVETFDYSKAGGYWGLDAKAFSALLKANGLTTASGHYNMDPFFVHGKTDEFKSYIEAAKITGQSYIIVPSIDGDILKSKSDFQKVAANLNKAAEMCKASGLMLGYHNHNFEWKPADGTTFYDTILKETDPKLVHMEMDIFWVVRAGQDPIKILEKHSGRFALVHIKDRDKKNTDINTEIGKGSIDFKAIIPKARAAGVKHFLMEQENYTNIDPYLSITESCNYMKNTLHV